MSDTSGPANDLKLPVWFRTDLIFRPKSPKARWRYYGKKALRHERMKDARAEKAALNTGRAWKKKAQ